MNILWFSHLVPYPQTGPGVLQRSYHLVRELARAHRVHLLAFVQGKIVRDLLGDLDAGLATARQHLEEYCERVEFLPIPAEQKRLGRQMLAIRSLLGGHPYSIRWLQTERARRLLAGWSSGIDFDVVHFDTLSLAPYRRLFSHGAATLDHHNIESSMMLRRARMEPQPLRRLYFWQEGVRLRRFEQQMCPAFDLNITCSAVDTQRLRAVVPGVRVEEVPNGVDISYFRPDEGSEEPLSLVFAGNMSWYPNAAAMLFFAERVWPALKREVPQLQMNVVGGDPPARLKAIAKSDASFNVHGFVPDVRPYLHRSAVYVCPIMDGGGTKLKILDALATGKPIVAHPVACEGIEVVDGKHVLFAREPEEFVAQIVALLNSPERRRQMAHNGRALAESTYSYHAIGQKLIAEFERCSALHAQTRKSA